MERTSNWFVKILSRLQIKKSLAILFILLFFIPVILISFFFIFFLYNTMKDMELANVNISLSQTEININNSLNTIQTFSDRIYVNKQIQTILTTEYKNIEDVYDVYGRLDFLEDYLTTYAEVSSYRFYVNNKTLLDNQFIIKTNDYIETQGWYNTAIEDKGKIRWSYIYDNISKKNNLSLTRSIWSNDNKELVAVLVINFDTNYMHDLLSQSIYETYILYNNQIIFTSRKEKVSSYENQLIRFYNVSKNQSRNLTNISMIGEEKVGLYAVDFVPGKNTDITFTLLYIIPTKQMINATVTTIIVSVTELLIVMLLSVVILLVFSRYIDNRVRKINKQVNHIVDKNFEIAPSIGGKDEFATIYDAIYGMSGDLKNLVQEVYVQNLEKEQLALKQSEINFQMLANQINPHFLFNTIETIRMKALASGGDKDVAKMLKLLAALLRYNLSVKGHPVELTKEIEAVENYLTIQNMRFKDRIFYQISVNGKIDDVQILPLLIQPIVENSFNHGLEDTVKGGLIIVSINKQDTETGFILKIEVTDNGVGISEEKLKEIRYKLSKTDLEENKSIGLYNVNSRIKMFYGQDSGITFESEEGKGTIVTITIIQNNQVNGE